MEKIPTKCLNARKVLPLVYDESLSYYENLCKLTNKINDVIDTFNQVIDGTIEDYIDERINALFINTTYDEATETLQLFISNE